jgi:hypothetical protein
MSRRKLPSDKRKDLLKESRLVTMVSASIKERVERAAQKLDYTSTSDLVREAIEDKLKKLSM